MRRVVILLIVAAACRAKADGPPCGAVAGRFFTIARADLGNATIEPVTRRAVSDQLPAMRDSLASACSDGAWSTAVRTCMVNASDHVALQAEQTLSDDQRRGLDRAARGDTSP